MAKEKDKRTRRGFLEDSSLSSWLSDDGMSVDRYSCIYLIFVFGQAI